MEEVKKYKDAKELYNSETFVFLINAAPEETGCGEMGEVTDEHWEMYNEIYQTVASLKADVLPYLCRIGTNHVWVLICEYCDYISEHHFNNDNDAMVKAASEIAQKIASDEVLGEYFVYFGEDTGLPTDTREGRSEVIVTLHVGTDIAVVKEVVERLGDMAYQFDMVQV